MNKEILNAANIVTSFRLIGAIIILFLEPLTASFFIVYTLCGVTDGIDGTIARKCGTASPFGAKLDSASDLVFYTVMLIKMFPYLLQVLPLWVWVLLIFTVVIRIIMYAVGAFKQREFVARHTYMNKVVGALVFLVPYIMLLECKKWVFPGIVIMAFIAAIDENRR